MNVNLCTPLSPESMFGQWAIVKRFGQSGVSTGSCG